MSSRKCALLSISLLIIILFSSLFYVEAFAEEMVVLTIFVNSENMGDFFLVLTEDRDILIKREDFKTTRLSVESANTVTFSGEPYISLRSIPGLSFEVQEKTASLIIQAPPELFTEQRLDVSFQKPYKVTYTKDNSAFFNYGLQYSTDRSTLDLSTEIGLRIGDALATSSFVYLKGEDINRNIRLLTTVRTDSRETLRTLFLGDAPAVSGILGSSEIVGGVTLTKNYNIDPYLIRFPSLTLGGAITTPSEVNLYVNGFLTRQERLDPGEFQLKNVPAIVGLGNADIVIKDAFGREHVISKEFYYSDRLLERGLHEYSYSIGFLREDFGTKSFSYGNPAILAFHNYGFTDRLKGGFALEASDKTINAGPTASFLISKIGVVDAAFAASSSDGKTGFGSYLNYSFLSSFFNANLSVRSLTRNYSNLMLSPSDDKVSFELGGVTGWTHRRYGSLSLAYSFSQMHVGHDIKQYAASYNKIVTRNVTFFSIASRREDEQGRNDQLFLGLNVYFGKGISANLNYTARDGGDIATVGLQKNLPPGPGFGFNANVETQGTNTNLLGSIQYQNDYGIYGIRAQKIGEYEDYIFSTAGGIGYLDGSFFVSRPITDAFAKVNVDGLEGVRVYAFGNEIGKTDKRGNIIIPDIRSFLDNKIDIENRDIPINYSIPTLAQYISPPFRGGSLVRFAVTKIQGISGRILIIEDGMKKPLEGGDIQAYVKEKTITGLIGRNGEFYIENVPEGSHPAQITYKSRECHFELTIPKSEEIWIDIGEVICPIPVLP